MITAPTGSGRTASYPEEGEVLIPDVSTAVLPVIPLVVIAAITAYSIRFLRD